MTPTRRGIRCVVLPSTAGAAVELGLLLLVAVVLTGGSANAQTVPNTKAYLGPDCFVTVAPQAQQSIARIAGSREPGMHMYSTGDEVFLRGGNLQPGLTYAVYRVDGMLQHPSTSVPVGDVVNLVGRVRVIEAQGQRAIALITSACIEFEVGDPVGPILPTDVSTGGIVDAIDENRLVTPRASDATVVLGTSNSMYNPLTGDRQNLSMWETYAAGDVITIDQGRADGWRVDTPAMIYQDRNPSVAVSAAVQSEPVLVGQGIVFWLEETTATLLITDGNGAVRIGSRARPRGQ